MQNNFFLHETSSTHSTLRGSIEAHFLKKCLCQNLNSICQHNTIQTLVSGDSALGSGDLSSIDAPAIVTSPLLHLLLSPAICHMTAHLFLGILFHLLIGIILLLGILCKERPSSDSPSLNSRNPNQNQAPGGLEVEPSPQAGPLVSWPLCFIQSFSKTKTARYVKIYEKKFAPDMEPQIEFEASPTTHKAQ